MTSSRFYFYRRRPIILPVRISRKQKPPERPCIDGCQPAYPDHLGWRLRNNRCGKAFELRRKCRRTGLINIVAVLERCEGINNDFEMERVEAVSPRRQGREYRGADQPGHLRSAICREWRAAFIWRGRQCGAG